MDFAAKKIGSKWDAAEEAALVVNGGYGVVVEWRRRKARRFLRGKLPHGDDFALRRGSYSLGTVQPS